MRLWVSEFLVCWSIGQWISRSVGPFGSLVLFLFDVVNGLQNFLDINVFP